MNIIVDTNIVFSALLKEHTFYRRILEDDEYKIYSPSIMLTEVISHEEKILKYSKIDKNKFYEFFHNLIANITFVNEKIIPLAVYKKAFLLCNEYDDSDTPFIALAIHLDAKLWTGDKIKEHLRKKGFNNFFEMSN